MNITVIGQGYVGLTAAACLAEAGHRVVGVERDNGRLRSLRDAVPPFFEPGLEAEMQKAIESGALTFAEALDGAAVSDVVIVAVGSPQLPSGASDLSQVAAAFAEVAAMEAPPAAIVLKSTVPPGTSDRLVSEYPAVRDRFIFCPEFLSQGSALRDWKAPARLVAGLSNAALEPLVRDLYRGVDAPLVMTTPIDAEMIKYASNAFLATKISFVNEIANVCEAIGADIETVTAGVGLDPRVGSSYLRAGIGYGGSCFPKDTRALAHLSNVSGTPMRLLESVISVNEAQRLRPVAAIRSALADLPGPHSVAVLGLTFKPGTDDVREAPSHGVVGELLRLGLEVRAWDPALTPDRVRTGFPGVVAATHVDEAVAGASCVCVLTEWPEIVGAEWQNALIPSLVPPRLVFDGRNALDGSAIVTAGGRYQSVGRRTQYPAEAATS